VTISIPFVDEGTVFRRFRFMLGSAQHHFQTVNQVPYRGQVTFRLQDFAHKPSMAASCCSLPRSKGHSPVDYVCFESRYNLGMLTRNVPALVLGILGVTLVFAQSPQYVQGPRGGCYEVTKSGAKKSVSRSLCGQNAAPQSAVTQSSPSNSAPARTETRSTASSTSAQPSAPAPAAQTKVVKGNRTYIKGPKGGCYTVSASGRKEYVDRAMCQ